MLHQLEAAFDLSAVGVSDIVGTYYYTYAVVSLIAGVALDKAGAKFIIPAGAVLFAVGCLLFIADTTASAYVGRMLQGAGSAFAFTGAVYLAARAFSPSVLATAIGVTQSMGMLGGSAGQFAVGPLIQRGLPWQSFWLVVGAIAFAVAICMFVAIPAVLLSGKRFSARDLVAPYKVVLSNPQSYLCGIVAGLLFAPTTIGIMTWGVAFFQLDRSYSYEAAVYSASLVPLGWAVGCPALGRLADKLGRRKPVVIFGAAAMILGIAEVTFTPQLLPTGVVLFLLGVVSGAAMIPYTIIKEVNPDDVKGSATGAINFINFAVTSVVGPVFSMLYGRTLTGGLDPVSHFQGAGLFWLATVVLALIFSIFLRETGAVTSRVALPNQTPIGETQ
jgi:MFS family permease